MSDEPQDWRTTKEMIAQDLCPKCGSEMAYLDHEGKDPDSIRWVCFVCGHEEKVKEQGA